MQCDELVTVTRAPDSLFIADLVRSRAEVSSVCWVQGVEGVSLVAGTASGCAQAAGKIASYSFDKAGQPVTVGAPLSAGCGEVGRIAAVDDSRVAVGTTLGRLGVYPVDGLRCASDVDVACGGVTAVSVDAGSALVGTEDGFLASVDMEVGSVDVEASPLHSAVVDAAAIGDGGHAVLTRREIGLWDGRSRQYSRAGALRSARSLYRDHQSLVVADDTCVRCYDVRSCGGDGSAGRVWTASMPDGSSPISVHAAGARLSVLTSRGALYCCPLPEHDRPLAPMAPGDVLAGKLPPRAEAICCAVQRPAADGCHAAVGTTRGVVVAAVPE
eukprot:TRINITY_DN17014_c0_g1_i1.p1 TRINITY_DN17014_c0_g1~~TRINITY_DN17014_c0_g1_i1.p1  ORF type:complete len:360 (+),score=117.52 TRINITY_DN17014_c0_g1_i1:98-1081(+)